MRKTNEFVFFTDIACMLYTMLPRLLVVFMRLLCIDASRELFVCAFLFEPSWLTLLENKKIMLAQRNKQRIYMCVCVCVCVSGPQPGGGALGARAPPEILVKYVFLPKINNKNRCFSQKVKVFSKWAPPEKNSWLRACLPVQSQQRRPPSTGTALLGRHTPL